MPLPIPRASVGHILANLFLQNVTTCGHQQAAILKQHGMAKDFTKSMQIFQYFKLQSILWSCHAINKGVVVGHRVANINPRQDLRLSASVDHVVVSRQSYFL